MMLSSNFNRSFQQTFLNQQQPVNSVDSNSGSFGSNSLLTAANTLIFNSPSSSPNIVSPGNASNFGFSFLQQPQQQLKNQKHGSFTKTLLDLKESNQNDLDFDIDYKSANICHTTKKESNNEKTLASKNVTGIGSFSLSKLNEINFEFLNQTNKNIKGKKETSFDEVLFKDDNDTDQDLEFFDQNESIENENDDENNESNEIVLDENSNDNSIESLPQINRMVETNTDRYKSNIQPKITLGKILNNPIGFAFKNQNQQRNDQIHTSKNMAIEMNNNKSSSINNNNVNNNNAALSNNKNERELDIGSIKKIPFPNQNELSPNSLASASFNSTSILNDTTPQNSVSSMKQPSRTLMKLQLMKQQAEQNEKKAAAATPMFFQTSSNNSRQQDSSNNFLFNNKIVQNNQNFSDKTNEFSFNPSNGDISLPSSLTSAEIIPKSMLPRFCQIETKLEYPTKYHVMQIAKNLKQSTMMPPTIVTPGGVGQSSSLKVTSDTGIIKKNKKNNQINTRNIEADSHASSSDISILPNNSSFFSDSVLQEKFQSYRAVDSPSSNFDNKNQSLSTTCSSFSQADYADEIDDLVPDELNYVLSKRLSTNLTSYEIQKEINKIEECLNLPKTMPDDSNFKIMSPSLSTSIRASYSCPSDLTRLKKLQGINLTEDELKAIIRERQKKDNHNIIERRRRYNINDRIKELGTILPKLSQGEIKQNKGSILKASVDYIKSLQYELNKNKELELKFRQMRVLNEKLINRIKELENQTHQNNSSNYNQFQHEIDVSNIKQEPVLLNDNESNMNSQVNSNRVYESIHSSSNIDYTNYIQQNQIFQNNSQHENQKQNELQKKQLNSNIEDENSSLTINDAALLEEIFNSHGDSFLLDANLYDIMDSNN